MLGRRRVGESGGVDGDCIFGKLRSSFAAPVKSFTTQQPRSSACGAASLNDVVFEESYLGKDPRGEEAAL